MDLILWYKGRRILGVTLSFPIELILITGSEIVNSFTRLGTGVVFKGVEGGVLYGEGKG